MTERAESNQSEYTLNQACRDVWAGLNKIDCSKHVKDKNGLTYLSWAWAYQMIMDNYPDFNYMFDEVVWFPNGTAEVRVNCTLGYNGHIIKRNMWLPVMDHRNKALVNPDATAINKAKMRCLTKCISMFGLGAYIYAGEDLPSSDDAPAVTAAPPCRDPDGPQQVFNPRGEVSTIQPLPPGIKPVQYETVQTVQPELDVKTPVIADEQGAEELVSVLVGIAGNMHTETMADLADFWRQNKATIDVLDARFPTQYQKLKAAFTELKSSLQQ